MSEILTLHKPFAEYLTRIGIPFVYARPDVESTIALGHPDFTLLLGGRCIMVEFKVKDGKVSADQRKREAELTLAGNLVLIIRDLDAAIRVVDHWRAGIGEIRPAQARPGSAAQAADERVIGGSVYRLNPASGRYEFVRLTRASEPHTASPPAPAAPHVTTAPAEPEAPPRAS